MWRQASSEVGGEVATQWAGGWDLRKEELRPDLFAMRIPFLSSGHALDKYRHGETPFALVTGASAGIGTALAFELAALNYNVILHARKRDRLEVIQDEIADKHPGVKVVLLVQDAAEKVDWPQIMSQIEELNITILINNVGAPTPVPFNALECATDEQIEQTIRVNTIFPTQLTRNLLPILLRNGPSLILNMCSAAAYVPPAFISVYCGTKASNLVWSQALTNELHYLKRDEVTCKAVVVGAVQSGGYDRPTSTFVPTSKEYARSMLAHAGSSGAVYAGTWRHWFQFLGASIMPFLPAVLRNMIIATASKDLLVWRMSMGDKTAMKP